MIVRPDYQGGGIVNLMASLRQGMGGAGHESGDYAAAGALDPAEIADARHVLLLVIDGLGHDWLRRHGRGALGEHLHARLTTVFPSTTAAAITTFFTGQAPLQHGLTGWYTYVAELDAVVAPLPFRHHDGHPLVDDGVSPAVCFGTPPLFPLLARECHVVHPVTLIGSPYNAFHAIGAVEHGYEDMDGLFDTVRELLLAPGAARYVYAYWPELDRLCHQHGSASAHARRHLRLLEAGFERLLGRLRGSGTLVLATADHGFMDTREQTRTALIDHPDMLAMLRQPVCGEPRALICHLQPGAEQDFDSYVRERLPGCESVFPGRTLIAEGWFGRGEPHPQMATRAGDRVLLMHDAHVVNDQRTGKHVHIGEHGGTSPAEMYVPLMRVSP